MNLESESESEEEQPTNPAQPINPALVNAAAPTHAAAPQPGIHVGIPVVPSQAAVPSESSAPSEHAVPSAPAPPGEDALATETSDGLTASREVNNKIKVLVVGDWLWCMAALKDEIILNRIKSRKTYRYKFQVLAVEALANGLIEKIGETYYLTGKTMKEDERVPVGSRFTDNDTAVLGGMLWVEVRVLRDTPEAKQMLKEEPSKPYHAADISDVMVSVTRSDLADQQITGLKRKIDELQSELLQARRQVFVDVD